MQKDKIPGHAPKFGNSFSDEPELLTDSAADAKHTAEMSSTEANELARVSKADEITPRAMVAVVGDEVLLETATAHGVQTAEVPTKVQRRLVRAVGDPPQTRRVGRHVIEPALEMSREGTQGDAAADPGNEGAPEVDDSEPHDADGQIQPAGAEPDDNEVVLELADDDGLDPEFAGAKSEEVLELMVEDDDDAVLELTDQEPDEILELTEQDTEDVVELVDALDDEEAPLQSATAGLTSDSLSSWETSGSDDLDRLFDDL